MVNALFLIAAMAVVFVFGYRFYAKLLALDLFRLDKNYSTPAQTRADGRDVVPANRHVLFGYHIASAGVFAAIAPIVALSWGWVPAFLWVTIGAAVIGGTHALAAFWLTLHHPDDLGHVARRFLGAPARVALLVLAGMALLILIAACAGITASVLAAFPTAVLPLIGVTLIALAVGAFLRGRAEFEILPTALIALASSLLLVWVFARLPLAFRGTLDIALGDTRVLSIDSVLVWTVLTLVYALYAARAPLWRSMRPRGLLMALLLAVALFMVYVALAIQHPTLQAPQFRAAESAAGALPWLFLILTSGALAGFQLLIIYGITGRQLRHETDARYLGYGGALAEGVVALSAILIGATAAADSNTWALQYLALPSAAEFPRAATLYIDGYARLLGALGIDVASARNLAATVLAGMALAGTEAGTRALKQLLGPAAAPTPSPARRYEGRGRLWVIVALAAAIALGDGRGLGGLLLWPVLALAGLWIACAGLAATALALRALQRGAALLWALVLGVGAIAAWASVAQLTEWLQAGAWGRSILGGVVVLAALALLGSGAHRYRGATDPTTARPPA